MSPYMAWTLRAIPGVIFLSTASYVLAHISQLSCNDCILYLYHSLQGRLTFTGGLHDSLSACHSAQIILERNGKFPSHYRQAIVVTLPQVDELEAKLKEVEGVCSPIVSKMYQAGGGNEDGASTPGAGGFPSAAGASSGPTVEEVD